MTQIINQYIYCPKKYDQTDTVLANYLNNETEHEFTKVLFKNKGYGNFEFGHMNVFMSLTNGQLLVS